MARTRPRVRALALFLFFALPLLAAGCAQPRHAISDVGAGFHAGTYDRLDALLQGASSNSPVPGGVLAIARDGQIVYTKAFGWLDLKPGADRVSGDTLFDVASLTKPMAGVPSAIMYIRSRRPPEEERRLLAMLLDHTAGLDDGEAYPKLIERMRGVSPDEALGARPDGIYRYSNAGYAYIGIMVEGAIAEAELRNDVWDPMGLKHTGFHPPKDAPIAVSGMGKDGEPLAGSPFDSLAGIMSERGLMPLHSGLFSTAADVAMFGDRLMNGFDSPVSPILREVLIGSVEGYPDADGGMVYESPGGMLTSVGLPWAPANASTGRVYRHTGYTGTLLWLDTRTRTSVAFLTNASDNQAQEEWQQLTEQLIATIIQGLR